MLKEFRAAGKSGRELHGIMAGELEAVVNSWELPTIQRDLLWLELDLSGIGSNQPARGKRTESTCGPEPFELLKREASSVQQRLCWWRDPENYGFDGFPEEKAADLEARYRYERAQAEVQFLTNCDGLKGVPLSGNENLIAFNLENYIGAFLHHSLYAFADFLLDKRMPGTEALRAFEQHANELLTETFNSKWLFGLRHFELTEDESSEKQFWAVQQETVASTRREFEGLLWKAELEEAASPVARNGARECRDEIQPTQQAGATRLSGDELTRADAGPALNGPDRRAAVVSPILRDRGITRSKWAAIAGVDPSVVYDYMRGVSNPRPDSRKALAEAIGLKEAELPE